MPFDSEILWCFDFYQFPLALTNINYSIMIDWYSVEAILSLVQLVD